MKLFAKILILIFATCVTFGLFFLIDFGKVQVVRGEETCLEDADCGPGKKCVGAKSTEEEMVFGVCEEAPESQPTGEGGGPAGGTIGEEEVVEARLQSPIRFKTPLELINAIISAILGVIGILSIIFIIWGGYGYIMAGGSEERIQEAKRRITYAIIGLVLAIGAYILINSIIKAIGG